MYYIEFLNDRKPYECKTEEEFKRVKEKYKLRNVGANIYVAVKKPSGKKKRDNWKGEMLKCARELQYPQIVRKLLLNEENEFKCQQIMTFARLGYYD